MPGQLVPALITGLLVPTGAAGMSVSVSSQQGSWLSQSKPSWRPRQALQSFHDLGSGVTHRHFPHGLLVIRGRS